jgi:chromodomain-helicase-DNA-binding protein 1
MRHPGPNDYKPTREDLEAFEIEIERRKEELENWKNVERVISSRQADANDTIDHPHAEYLCKWTGLPYSECTWEAEDTIKNQATQQIAEYMERDRSETVPWKSTYYAPGKRPPFTKITEDPAWLTVNGGSLKEFQRTGLNWLAYLWSKEQNGILADEVRLAAWILAA